MPETKRKSSPARGTWIEIRPRSVAACRASRSSPARGTWIEINEAPTNSRITNVVPRKGDVDRNRAELNPYRKARESSPARGTWIEISVTRNQSQISSVVPRKGDVDRNAVNVAAANEAAGRPPQGGRG